MIYEVFFILCVVLLLFYYFSINTYTYWKIKSVPYVNPTPLLGNFANVFLMRESFVSAISRLYNSFPDAQFIGTFQGRRPTLLIKNPNLIKNILVRDFECFTDRVAITTDVKREPILRNITNMSGEEWKAFRQALLPAFSSGKTKAMFPIIKECSLELVRVLNSAESTPINIADVLTSYMIDIIGSCAFGIQISALNDDNSQFRYMARRIFTPTKWNMLKRYCRSYFPAISKLFNLRSIPKEIESFFFTLMKDIITLRDESNEERADFVQLLLNLRDGNDIDGAKTKYPVEITQSLITSQSFIFFLAGLETTSSTMSFCLYELAMNPDIQEKIFHHINKITKGNKSFTFDNVQSMTYLGDVLLETHRKHPAVPITTRRCNKPYKLPGTDVTLAVGDNVLIPIFAVQNDPLYYPNPQVFDPERFNESFASRNNSLFLTFGIGPRSCIANRFAHLVMVTCLAEFLQMFKVFPCSKTPPKVEYDSRSMFLRMKGGIWLKIERR